jgi:hypothetical protein
MRYWPRLFHFRKNFPSFCQSSHGSVIILCVIMIQTADPITISVSRSMLADIVQLSAELTDRMHELLERNTDGSLTSSEKAELESLVRMAQFGQIVSVALPPSSRP